MPRLRLRWAGFRKVHKQVCKHISRRVEELGLSGLSVYREYLDLHPGEWRVLDSLCGITISRFYRDRGVFDFICSEILPSLAKDALLGGGDEVRCWSAGCCSGEEAYTLQIVWKLRILPALQKDLPLRITATDINRDVLKRAREGSFSDSSLVDLPDDLRRQAFTRSEKLYSIKNVFMEDIEFREQDIRLQLPDGRFHLILCRNIVFTYFEDALQQEIFDKILDKLHHGGSLVIGIHETLPKAAAGVRRHGVFPGVYKKENKIQ